MFICLYTASRNKELIDISEHTLIVEQIEIETETRGHTSVDSNILRAEIKTQIYVM